MYGLHQTLTRSRNDGLGWRITVDARSGVWMPTLVVVDLTRAWECYPLMILRALNGTSIAVRSQMFARLYIRSIGDTRHNYTPNMLDFVLTETIGQR